VGEGVKKTTEKKKERSLKLLCNSKNHITKFGSENFNSYINHFTHIPKYSQKDYRKLEFGQDLHAPLK
jgi:hypothetical protein